MKFDNTLLYRKVKLHIRQHIFEKAESQIEVRIDAERKMAEDLGVSRSSINKAIAELAAEGFLIKKRGKGVFIPPKEKLVSKESELNTIALLLPDTKEYYYGEIAREIEKIAFEKGIKVMICLVGGVANKERSFLSDIYQNRAVKGIIAVPHLSRDNVALYQKLQLSGVPIVLINRIHESMHDLPHIVYDQAQGAEMGVRHMFEGGKKKMLFIGDEAGGYHSFLRKKGFDQAVSELKGVQGFDIYANDEDFTNKLKTMVDLHKIDGIVAYNDIIATRAMNILINKGYKIPEEIGIVGFDNSDWADIALVTLTSVKFPKKRLANMAFDMIYSFINEEPCVTSHLIPVSLEVRASTTK